MEGCEERNGEGEEKGRGRYEEGGGEREGILTSDLIGSCDERANHLSVHIRVGQAAATHYVVGLGDGLADPGCDALEREGALLELLVKLFALVVYAMTDDNRGDETEASIGRVDAQDIEPMDRKSS